MTSVGILDTVETDGELQLESEEIAKWLLLSIGAMR
jgi:hypothetical protein